MKRIGLSASFAIIAALAAGVATAQDGTLNPEEGGLYQLTETLRKSPERAGFTCWVVYETQKGGLHSDAFAALQQCAASGNEPSMILLSHAYENGLGTRPNAALATYWAKQAALAGYSVGQYHYGVALLAGHGVPRDEGQAGFWLGRAAMAGDTAAAKLLATLPLG